MNPQRREATATFCSLSDARAERVLAAIDSLEPERDGFWARLNERCREELGKDLRAGNWANWDKPCIRTRGAVLRQYARPVDAF